MPKQRQAATPIQLATALPTAHPSGNISNERHIRLKAYPINSTRKTINQTRAHRKMFPGVAAGASAACRERHFTCWREASRHFLRCPINHAPKWHALSIACPKTVWPINDMSKTAYPINGMPKSTPSQSHMQSIT